MIVLPCGKKTMTMLSRFDRILENGGRTVLLYQ